MTKYNFMWGGKLSVMLNQAMISQLTRTIDNKGKEINTNIDEALFVIKDGVFELHMPDNSVKRLELLGKRYLDPKYRKLVNTQIEDHIKNFFKFCKKYENTDFKNCTNNELKNIMKEYHEFVRKGLVYFAASSPFTTNAIEERIKAILKQKKEVSMDDYFISLTTPEEMDVTMLERIHFLKLMQSKNITKNKLISYSRKYPALFWNTYNKEEIMLFLNNKLKEKKTNKEINSEIKRIKDNLTIIKKKHNEIFRLYNNNELKQLSSDLQKIALDRYRLKHVWSGAEYMFLDMFSELAKKADISLEDFVKIYSFTDIYSLLDDKAIKKDKINGHKQLLIFHYMKGRINTSYGKNAETYLSKLKINKEKEEEISASIKGTTANKGKVTNKVKLVNVRDLKQFVKDCENFKKGEILVTTMTSPIMVQIIEKAGGIVTVEGGICSHAAVISREFNIPCIVGTGNATKVLKDGDLVEVNADEGTVKILKRNK